MSKLMLIDASHPEETRVVISENDRVQEYDFVTSTKNQVKGNIYLAKVTRVEPSLQAAFVEYGMGRQGFLPFAEIHPDYYQIPSADKQALMAQAEREGADERHEAHDQGDETSENAERFDDQPEQEGDFADHLTPDHHPDPHEEHSGNARADGEGQVETFAAEEEELAPRPRRYGFLKRYKINEVIRKGQVLLVQVIKEERGNKGAALTTYISLAGRYCVLMPNTSKSSGGISRKVTNGEDRARLRDVVDSLPLAPNMNVIMRTAGVDRSKAEIRRDFDYLSRLWDDIRELTMASTAPALVYEESDLIKRAIRDLYKTDIEHIVIEGEESYNSAKNFMKMLMPSHAPRVKQYKGDIPLYYAYEVEDQLLSMHDPVVRLRSGGYLVINQTEALVAIDINSGRSTRERNVEETALKTNLEAAAEIARQLRLRDLAGLLVIDFIDMYEFRHRRAVERTLKDALRTDRAKIQIGRISAFGLLEMSRQRLRPSIEETSSHPCDHCNGTGVVRSAASIAVQMLRMIEREAYDTVGGSISATSHPDVALYVLNNKRLDLLNLERKYDVQITILHDNTLLPQAFLLTRRAAGVAESYTINEAGEYVGRKPPGNNRKAAPHSRPALPPMDREEAKLMADEEESYRRADAPVTGETAEGEERSGRRRRRRGGRGRNGRNREEGSESGAREFSSEEGANDANDFIEKSDFVDNSEERAEGAEVETPQGEHRGRERGGRNRRGGLMRRRWNQTEENPLPPTDTEFSAPTEFVIDAPTEFVIDDFVSTSDEPETSIVATDETPEKAAPRARAPRRSRAKVSAEAEEAQEAPPIAPVAVAPSAPVPAPAPAPAPMRAIANTLEDVTAEASSLKPRASSGRGGWWNKGNNV